MKDCEHPCPTVHPLLTYGKANSSASAVDPEKERDPPPPPTLVYFPQNDLDEHSFQIDETWAKHIPDLFKQYSHISKPAEVGLEHIRALNVSVKGDVELERLIPVASDGHDYLPRSLSAEGSRRNSLQKHPDIQFTVTAPNHRLPILSNGHKAPDDEMYMKYAKQLTCENEDALRNMQKKKPRPGHAQVHITEFRRFWSQLDLVSNYWDTSLDHYYEAGSEPATQKSPKGFKRLSMALSSGSSDSHKPATGHRYKGRRISTGSKMPDQFRVDMVRHLIEPIAWAFGCISMNPKKVPQMQVGRLRLPVTQTAVVWRNSQDKASSKKGITEGPLLGVQCRSETGFVRDKHTASLDAAREIAGLLLLAEERAREGKAPLAPGDGKWWTSKPRWGGGHGGEFGDADGNKDHPAPAPSSVTVRRGSMPIHLPAGARGRSEEDIWRELKSGPGLFDPQHTYLAVGKDRAQPYDSVSQKLAFY